MLIDTHTHTWDSLDQRGGEFALGMLSQSAQPWDRADASLHGLEQASKSVDFTFILGIESSRTGANITAAHLARYVAHQPEKFLGFPCLNPDRGDPGGQIEQVIALNMTGVTLSPAAQGISLLDPRTLRLLQLAAERGLPLIIQPDEPWSSRSHMELAQPWMIDELARALPSLRMVVGAMGRPYIEQTLWLLVKHPHLYADVAWVVSRPWHLWTTMLQATEIGVTHKLLFASGFPLCTPELAMNNLLRINDAAHHSDLPRIDRYAMVALIERDALACLGIKADAKCKVQSSK